jgi:hypothetical protein
LECLSKLAAAKTLATGVDDTLMRWLGMPKCKIAKLADALLLGAVPVATGQSPFAAVPTPEATESNAKTSRDLGLSRVDASPLSKISSLG